MSDPTTLDAKPSNRRALIILLIGGVLVALFLAYKMFMGGGDTAAPVQPTTVTTAAPAGAAAAPAAPAAAAPAPAPNPPAPAAPAGPAPNTTRDPFKALK